MNTPWLLLLISQPTGNAALRMRIWREMKARGAASLRDGVHLLPDGDSQRAAFDLLADAVEHGGGSTHVVRAVADEAQHRKWRLLFDRSAAYADLFLRCQQLLRPAESAPPEALRREVSELEDEFAAIAAVDYFPGETKAQLARALSDLRAALERRIAPDEPQSASTAPEVGERKKYQGRVWATRRNLWIDRVASAWLIHRFIDPQARFVWIKTPAEKPTRAVGFDFDGAEFSHAAGRVTFEVLARSFGLDGDPAIARIGAIVHKLDVGGVSQPEAGGVEALLGGLRMLHPDDDGFLASAAGALDAYYASFSGQANLANSQPPPRRTKVRPR